MAVYSTRDLISVAARLTPAAERRMFCARFMCGLERKELEHKGDVDGSGPRSHGEVFAHFRAGTADVEQLEPGDIRASSYCRSPTGPASRRLAVFDDGNGILTAVKPVKLLAQILDAKFSHRSLGGIS